MNRTVARGIRFGKLGGAIGSAAGGALSGQNPAITAAMLAGKGRSIRPFDVRIDVYQGIMADFQTGAERVARALASAATGQ